MKKGLAVLLSMFLILNFYGCNENKKDTSKNDINTIISNLDNLNSKDKEKIIGELYSVKDIDEEKKIEIARELFEEYIKSNITDWKMVASQCLDRKPVIALTDYKIGKIDFASEDGNKFTVNVSYDIQYTNESDMWKAGNGTLTDNNWDVNKDTILDIKKYEDKFIITSIYN